VGIKVAGFVFKSRGRAKSRVKIGILRAKSRVK